MERLDTRGEPLQGNLFCTNFGFANQPIDDGDSVTRMAARASPEVGSGTAGMQVRVCDTALVLLRDILAGLHYLRASNHDHVGNFMCDLGLLRLTITILLILRAHVSKQEASTLILDKPSSPCNFGI